MTQDVTTTAAQDVARPYDGEATRAQLSRRPRTDIFETEDRIVVLAEMPGVPADNADVTLEQSVLTLRGRVPEARHDGYRQVYAEYAAGDYERVFTLSEAIDREGIEAKQENGVLVVELPKAAHARTRRIEVKSS